MPTTLIALVYAIIGIIIEVIVLAWYDTYTVEYDLPVILMFVVLWPIVIIICILYMILRQVYKFACWIFRNFKEGK